MYYSIGEVAEMFEVNASTLRFWEKEFKQIKPDKNRQGKRLYSVKDIENIKLIHHLVKEKGFTLKGAKSKLQSTANKESLIIEVKDRLQVIYQELKKLKESLD